MNKETIAQWFQSLQDDICHGLESVDGKASFQEDRWDRKQGGGGRSRVISNGAVFEKGGVNFSAVHGPTPEKVTKALGLAPADFFATGVSIVIHPNHPWVPIIHMNVRYFEMSSGTYWFGGGIDLTPHYIIPHDAAYFHRALRDVCDSFDGDYYPRFKQWADDYFFIKHREETRGVGGIFFDHLQGSTDAEKQELWEFVQAVGQCFLPTYSTLVHRNREKPYDENERQWQLLRRGRYVEFNLVYDKGTKFGLDTNGRTESILMSLPPTVQWEYNHQPESKSPEGKTLASLKKNINWIDA
ncbi:MAG: oxygen-dependent coproporphyrinogen oxidase [Bacteroidota bacterium]